MWGFSSAGRAPALHAGGQEFESPNLHNKKQDDISYPVFYYVRVRCRMSGSLTENIISLTC